MAGLNHQTGHHQGVSGVVKLAMTIDKLLDKPDYPVSELWTERLTEILTKLISVEQKLETLPVKLCVQTDRIENATDRIDCLQKAVYYLLGVIIDYHKQVIALHNRLDSVDHEKATRRREARWSWEYK